MAFLPPSKINKTDKFPKMLSFAALLPSMIERKSGKIVFVSSVVGRLPIPYRSSYTASKHALQAFADCLRAEMAQNNIKVLVSSPGYVHTDVSRNALTGYGTLHGGKFSIFKANWENYEIYYKNVYLWLSCYLKYVVMDPETAAGERPDECAHGIFKAILCGENEVMPLKYIPAIWIRAIFPAIYFRALEMRARKLAARHSNNTQTV